MTISFPHTERRRNAQGQREREKESMRACPLARVWAGVKPKRVVDSSPEAPASGAGLGDGVSPQPQKCG
jgi:hypothetical protein